MTEQDNPDSTALLLYEATDQLRAVAKWLLTLFAGLLSLLLAGLSFSSIGDARRGWPLILAVISAAAVLAMFTSVIRLAAQMLGTTYYSFDQIFVEREKIEKQIPTLPAEVHEGVLRSIELAKAELYGDTGAVDLSGLLTAVRTSSVAVRKAKTDAERDAAIAQLNSARRGINRVLRFAQQDATKRQFTKLVQRVVAATAVSAVAIGVFAVSVNEDAPSSPPLPNAVGMVIYLSADGQQWVHRSLGCRVSTLRGVAIAGDYKEPQVAIPRQRGCSAARIDVTHAIGVAVPESR